MKNIKKNMKIMSSREKFEALLAWGEEGEKIVGDILLQQGYFVQPLYQYKAKQTPYIFYYNESVIRIIAPDISVIKDGQLTFVECKRKNYWVRGYGGEEVIETGIDNRLFLSYLQTFKLTNIPIEIYFIQETDDHLMGVYMIKIDSDFQKYYSPDYRRIDNMIKDGKEVIMSFFKYENLTKIKGHLITHYKGDEVINSFKLEK